MKPKAKRVLEGVGFWEGGCPCSLSILSIIAVINSVCYDAGALKYPEK